MVKKHVPPNIIDNLAFYTFGRLEREIEGLAERTGVLKSDFASRLSALLGNTPLWPVLGDPDPMSAVPQTAQPAGMYIQRPALALGESTPSARVHHDESKQKKGTRNRRLVAEAMNTLTSPMPLRDLHSQLSERLGLKVESVRNITDRLVKKGVLQKRNRMFFWDKESPTQPLNGAERKVRKVYVKKPPTMEKGQAGKMVLKFMKNRQMTQVDIIRALKKKYPEINPFVWNVTVTTLVRQNQLHRWASGLVTVHGASKPALMGEPNGRAAAS